MAFAYITEALSRIAAGNIPGATAVYLGGYNAAPTTTNETIWGNSNAYTFLSANMSSPTVVSGSANDAAAGTGARTIVVSGVDANFAPQSETVTMNGTSTVALVNNYMTINNIYVATAGSGLVAAANITLAAGGVTHGFLPGGTSDALQFIYTVPANCGLLMYDYSVFEEAASSGGNRTQISYRTNSGPTRVMTLAGIVTNGILAQTYTVPLYFAAKTQLQAQFLSAAATTAVSAISTCVLLDRTNTTDVTSYAKWI